MKATAQLGKTRPAGLTPEMRDWVDSVIVPALVDRWLAREAKKSLAEASSKVAECERERLSAEGVFQ